ncbi:spen [Symbiodinium natans]|uniref:Spen protein n=1 Tax=Symbiodinium natans TaxID=878477 RepID=A0A812H9Z9_9DINO|nr:spen [Symbiodinium natans]
MRALAIYLSFCGLRQVTTDTNRVIQLSRTPPTGLGFICPHFFGGTDLRLDMFFVGKAVYVQMDMPLKPIWADWIRTWCRDPWRRGTVSVRGEHGLLQIRRTNGEAVVAYRAMSEMIEAKKTRGLRAASLGIAEIFGLTAKEDIILPDEELIWEWKLNCVGHFTDPFDYTSLLVITDSRLHVARARCPKPPSLRGMLLGPRTCGFRWMHLQEWLGHHAGLTISSLAHHMLESYATTRSRAPPFWPGLGAPIDGFGFVFMPKFTQIYPAVLISATFRVISPADADHVRLVPLGRFSCRGMCGVCNWGVLGAGVLGMGEAAKAEELAKNRAKQKAKDLKKKAKGKQPKKQPKKQKKSKKRTRTREQETAKKRRQRNRRREKEKKEKDLARRKKQEERKAALKLKWKIKYQAEKEVRKRRRDEMKARDRAERTSAGYTSSLTQWA